MSAVARSQILLQGQQWPMTLAESYDEMLRRIEQARAATSIENPLGAPLVQCTMVARFGTQNLSPDELGALPFQEFRMAVAPLAIMSVSELPVDGSGVPDAVPDWMTGDDR